MSPEPRIIVALDYADAAAALQLVRRLRPPECRLKIGNELFTSGGPELLRAVQALGFSVFLDLKFHDIPNTVAGACAAATRLGVWMLNVHAAGGSEMLDAAHAAVVETSAQVGCPQPLLIAVTVLTSLDARALRATGVDGAPEHQVLRLAALAQASGLDGVVCSAQEASVLRAACGPGFKLVTPGIRPAGGERHDQARVMTPEAALTAGADYLVIGRAITAAPDPAAALDAIAASLDN